MFDDEEWGYLRTPTPFQLLGKEGALFIALILNMGALALISWGTSW